MKSLFNIMKYYFVQSDNNEIEKNLIAFNFLKKKVIQDNERYVNNITEGFDFYLNVLDMYLNCSFFNDMKIKEISRFKEKILERQLYIKNKMK